MSDADDTPASDPGDDAEDGDIREVVSAGDTGDASDADSDDTETGDGGPPVGREGVIDPDDLDIRDRDGVDETDDGRYVISTGAEREAGLRQVPDAAAMTTDDATADPDPEDECTEPGVTECDQSPPAAGTSDEDPLDAVAAELGSLSSSHGFALAVAAGGETATLRVASGDPTDTLATALRWYARQVNPGEDADETLAQLLAASDLDVG
ncbi:DUF7500 family protein [Halobaculum limi]|uniref:DUF7500 family protein n=1 Tax=Halobaculum limi TaxID=3031916 RepID=UPI00240580D5|nr:hypothetical protein [Halobaculum sp. YSMS11]